MTSIECVGFHFSERDYFGTDVASDAHIAGGPDKGKSSVICMESVLEAKIISERYMSENSHGSILN